MICEVGEEGRNQVAWVLRTQCLWVFQVEPDETALKCTSRNSEGMAGQNYIGVSYHHIQRTKVKRSIFFAFLPFMIVGMVPCPEHTQTHVCTQGRGRGKERWHWVLQFLLLYVNKDRNWLPHLHFEPFLCLLCVGWLQLLIVLHRLKYWIFSFLSEGLALWSSCISKSMRGRSLSEKVNSVVSVWASAVISFSLRGKGL